MKKMKNAGTVTFTHIPYTVASEEKYTDWGKTLIIGITNTDRVC